MVIYSCTGLAPSGLTPSGLTPSDLTPSGLTPTGLTPTGLTPTGLTPTGLTPTGLAYLILKSHLLIFLNSVTSKQWRFDKCQTFWSTRTIEQFLILKTAFAHMLAVKTESVQLWSMNEFLLFLTEIKYFTTVFLISWPSFLINVISFQVSQVRTEKKPWKEQ